MGDGAEHWARVESLERSGSLDELHEALADERGCWHTYTAAIRSLQRLHAVESGPAILKLLARNGDPDVQEAAVDALGALRTTRATRLLTKLAADGGPLAARARAALHKIRGGL